MTDRNSSSIIDRIFGRRELKNRIKELEESLDSRKRKIESLDEERESLESRVESLREQRAKEATEKQEAYKRKNQLEDKVEQLQDEIHRKEESVNDTDEIEYKVRNLSPPEVIEVVNTLNSIKYESDIAVVSGVQTGKIPDEVTGIYDNKRVLTEISPCIVLVDEIGIVEVGLEPVTNATEGVSRSNKFRLDKEMFLPTKRSLFVLVRSDTFAVGISNEDGELTYREGFKTNVKSSHSKGGFSQSRFERLREQQIERHIEKSIRKIEENMDNNIDRVIVTGQEDVVEELTEYGDVIDYTDASGSPEESLRDSYRSFWSLRMYHL